MKISKALSRVGAGTLAAATVVTGLAFGPAAAHADVTINADAPAPKAQSGVKLVTYSSQSDWQYYGLQLNGNNGELLWQKKFSSYSAAAAYSRDWNIPSIGETGRISDGYNNCLYVANTEGAVVKYAKCDSIPGGVVSQFRLNANGTISAGSRQITLVGSTGIQGWAVARTGNGWTFQGPATGMPFSAEVQEKDKVAKSAVIGGNAVPNSIIRVTGGTGTPQEIPVGDTGKWSATVTGLTLGQTNMVKSEEFVQQGTGYVLKQTRDSNVNFEITTLTADVHPGTLTSNATISGVAQAGARVQALDASGAVVSEEDATGGLGSYSLDIPAPDMAGDYPVTVRQVVGGEPLGNLPRTISYGQGVVVGSPIDNGAHTGGTLKMSGAGTPGSLITVREEDKQTVIGDVKTSLIDGSWNLETVTELDAGKHTLVVEQTAPGQNHTSATVTINPDAGQADLVVDAPAAGTNRVTGTASPNAKIVVKKGSNELDATYADDQGNWSFTVPVSLGAGTHGLTFTQFVDDTERDSKSATVDFGAAVVVQTPTASVPVTSKFVTFTGTGADGATVQVLGKSGRPLTAPATVSNGKWTATSNVELASDTYTVDVVQTTGLGVVSKAEPTFTVKAQAPVAQDVRFTGPARDSSVIVKKPVFSGTGEKGATVIVRGSVRTIATTTVKNDGTWSVQSEVALDNGPYALTAEQTPTNGAAKSSDTNPFTIAYKAAVAVQVATPGAGDTVGSRPTFTGTGEPFSKVVIKGSTRQVAEATVLANGTWTATSTLDLAKDTYNLTVEQTAPNTDVSRTTAQFTVR